MTAYRTRIVSRLYLQRDLEGLAALITSEDLLSRLEAASALQQLGDPRGFDFLISCLAHADPLVRGSAVELLIDSANLPDPGVLKPLLTDPDMGVRQAAADALASLAGDSEAPPPVAGSYVLQRMLWLDKIFILGGALFTLAGVTLILVGKPATLGFVFAWCCLIASGCFLGAWGLQQGGRRGYVAALSGCLALVLAFPLLTALGIFALKYIARPEVRMAFHQEPSE